MKPLSDREFAVAETLDNAETRLVTPWFEASGCNAGKLDYVAMEYPVALVYNGVSHAVMMASPQDLGDFAFGFSLSEGIIRDSGDIFAIDICPQDQGIEIQMDISSRRFSSLQQRRRQLLGRSGCGICGLEALQQVPTSLPRLTESVSVNHEAIQNAIHKLNQYQALQKLTGASHAAAWCDSQGSVQLIREDIGRHNALDKLVGARLRNGLTDPGFALVSSRASFEMVQKCAQAGMEILVAVSAATSLAIDMAHSCGLSLIGFGRSQRHVVYHDKGRIHSR